MKKIHLIVCALLTTTLITGCYYETDSKNDYSMETRIIEKTWVDDEEMIDGIDPGYLYNEGDDMDYLGMTFVVNYTMFANKIDKEYFSYFNDYSDLVDDEGKLEDGYSFVIANITIVNNEDSTFEQFGINSIRIYPFINDKINTSIVTNNIGELQGCIPKNYAQPPKIEKDFYKIDFEPQKEYIFDLLYIAKKDILDDGLILTVSRSSFKGTQEEVESGKVRFCRVNGAMSND